MMIFSHTLSAVAGGNKMTETCPIPLTWGYFTFCIWLHVPWTHQFPLSLITILGFSHLKDMCVTLDNDGHVGNTLPKPVSPSSSFSAHHKSLFLVNKINSCDTSSHSAPVFTPWKHKTWAGVFFPKPVWRASANALLWRHQRPLCGHGWRHLALCWVKKTTLPKPWYVDWKRTIKILSVVVVTERKRADCLEDWISHRVHYQGITRNHVEKRRGDGCKLLLRDSD